MTPSSMNNSIKYQELQHDVTKSHSNKLSYPESIMTSLYNKYPTLEDGIDISFDKTSTNHKVVDFTDLGIVHDGITNKFI